MSLDFDFNDLLGGNNFAATNGGLGFDFNSLLPAGLGGILGGIGGAARTAGGALAGFCERNPTICNIGGSVITGEILDVLQGVFGDDETEGAVPSLPTIPSLPGLPAGVGGAGGDVVALCAQVEQLRAVRDQANAAIKQLSPITRKATMLARLTGIALPPGCAKWVRKRRKPCRRRRARSCGTRRRAPRARARRACRTKCAPKRRRSCGRTAAQRRFAAAARRFGGRIPRGARL